MNRIQELQTRSEAPSVRNAKSAHEGTQFKEELKEVIYQVRDTEHHPADSVPTVMSKRSLLHLCEMSWDNHHVDIQHFMKSFHQLSGTVNAFTASEKKRKYIILSESEFASLKNFHWIRSPRISDDELEVPAYHNIMLFSSLSDAITHWIYLKVADGFTHNCKSDLGTGRHVIFSGRFRDPIKSTLFINGLRAAVHHVSLPFEDSSQFSKVYIGEFVEEIQIWSATTDQFHCSGSASRLMSQHVLFHESESVSSHCVDASLLDISNTEVGLTEQILSLIRTYRPHLESSPLKDSEFRVGLRDLTHSRGDVNQPMEINSHGR